ncbi:MAG: VanW family protein [Clostridia bacterium]|nr:VanW family protein [Clostridia bacterium]
MSRKLFCQISPTTYKISVLKCRIVRTLRNIFGAQRFAKAKQQEPLPVVIYKHNSLIRRKLGNTDLELQENKAVNLALSTPKVNGIIIRPGEVFSFWKLVGNPTTKKGYKEGVVLVNSHTERGIGGGLCQFTNLIHWMILHTPLKIVEHHHHDGFDLFPDFNRQVPFGTGTSIFYNYLDYRFENDSDITYQIIVYVTDTHLCGELRADKALSVKYHISAENEHFVRRDDCIYRKGSVYRSCIDKHSGNLLFRELLKDNDAKVMYDTSNLTVE